MSLDEALAMIAAEAVPPDLREARRLTPRRHSAAAKMELGGPLGLFNRRAKRLPRAFITNDSWRR